MQLVRDNQSNYACSQSLYEYLIYYKSDDSRSLNGHIGSPNCVTVEPRMVNLF